MCGICGFNWEDEFLIKKMTDVILHRGPDDEGHYVKNGVSFGNRRLAIQDLSPAGHMPMTYSAKDRSIVITFNGEIYNFKDVRKELEKKGYTIPPERILKVDWTSMDLSNCPQFKELRGWIQRKEIAALGIFDRDRLNAIGLQRLIFLSDCKEKGVELVVCQGPPILNEPEGQLVELALANKDTQKIDTLDAALAGGRYGNWVKERLTEVKRFLGLEPPHFTIHHGERSPQWDLLWQRIFTGGDDN